MENIELVEKEKPSLSFSLDLFKKKYTPAKFLLADKEKHSVSRFVTFEVTDNACIFKVNSMDSLYWSVIPVVNKGVPEGTYVLEYDVLLSVLDFIQNEYLILEFNTDFFNVKVLEGVVPLNCYTFDKTFCDKVTNDYKFTPVTAQESFKTFIALGADAMSLAMQPENRKIRIVEGSSYAFFSNCLFKFPFKFPVSLRGVDFKFLDAMLSINPDLTLQGINVSKEYVHLSFDDVVISFQKIKTDDLIFVVNEFNGLSSATNVNTLNLSEIQKKISLISTIVGRSEDITFKVANNEIFVFAETKLKTVLSFSLGVLPEAYPDYSIVLPIQSLLSLFNFIKSQENLSFYIDTQDRLVFFIPDLFTIVFPKVA